jgi:phosphinothricin acetyltransferase
MNINIRAATEADVPAITEIYNHEVLHGTATFDIEPKSLEDRLQWLRETQHPHAVIVAEVDGEVAGWGCLRQFRVKAAYRFTAENSVYIHRDRRGQGIGIAILARLVEVGRENNFHSIIAGIAEGNEPSVRLHRRFGFEDIGTEREVGYKFERWLDVTWMQLML